MPFPGTKLWNEHSSRFKAEDFDKFDSKTPLFSEGAFAEWHKRMLVAVQLKYYYSDEYAKFRDFHCGDTLDLRMKELAKEFDLNISWDKLLDLNI